MNDNDTEFHETDDGRKKNGLLWLWSLLALLLIPFLLWLLFFRSDDPNNAGQNSNAGQSSQTAQEDARSENNSGRSLKQRYEQQFNVDARTVLFNADSAVVQDETVVNAKLDAIAAFAKANSDAKFQVNGSIFDDNEVDSGSTLAKERAELIKSRLVEKGVNPANISVSTIDNYEGRDEAARAAYARSVVVTVKD